MLKHVPFDDLAPLDQKTKWAPEMKIAVNNNWLETGWWAKDAYFRGVLDHIFYDYGAKTLIITDWKTNRNLTANNDQLFTYGALAYAVLYNRFQFDQIMLRFYYLRFHKVIEEELNLLDLLDFRSKIDSDISRILTERRWEARYNNWCPYCQVREFCPLYKKVLDDSAVAGLSGEELAQHYVMAKTVAADLGEKLRSEVEQQDVPFGDGKYTINTVTRETVDSVALAKLLNKKKYSKKLLLDLISRGKFSTKDLRAMGIDPDQVTKKRVYTSMVFKEDK